MKISFRVPASKCNAEALLPDVQRFASQVTAQAVAQVEQEKQRVQCARGCWACCRQMVPVSPPEARNLVHLVKNMPPVRAAAVRERFSRARSRMMEADLHPEGHPDEDKAAYRAYGLAYFSTGVPCPFLEKESCSIYSDRPLVCREHLVTSPPAACDVIGSGQARRVPMPLSVWAAFGRSADPDGALEWMPLIDSLAYSEENPAPPPERTGPEHVEAFLKEIQRK